RDSPVRPAGSSSGRPAWPSKTRPRPGSRRADPSSAPSPPCRRGRTAPWDRSRAPRHTPPHTEQPSSRARTSPSCALLSNKVAARMFFVAYTKDGEDAKTRPVSFLYNGGPGAATIWLHMGSFAPRKVQMADEGFQPAPPYHLVDNEYSLLDATDMVYVDAIDTGYSRAVAGVSNTQFHGVRGDLRAFGEFINGYLKTYNRWPSPKFLIGESYGTIRSAGLSQELQMRHGIELNGIVLVSS